MTTRSRKGAATYDAVDANLSLPFDEQDVEANARPRVATTTWFLLHDRRDGRQFAELSRPKRIVDGFVQEWAPRIPIQTIDGGPMVIDYSLIDPAVTPDVPVKKRG